MWMNNILLLIRPIASTRIMGRPMISCKTIKVIGGAPPECTQVEQRSIGSVRRKLRWRRRKWYAWVNHEFNYLTVDVTFLPINQAAISRMTHQPVVYVALDENLSAELFPEWEVYGVVVCFIWWRSCGDRNIHFGSHRPWVWALWCFVLGSTNLPCVTKVQSSITGWNVATVTLCVNPFFVAVH